MRIAHVGHRGGHPLGDFPGVSGFAQLPQSGDAEVDRSVGEAALSGVRGIPPVSGPS
ncbi:hypothetical protein IM697_31415 [Streptomyces ferrugineus]|uniref:Uncharacterized protein n=1 Tax=Streptomyces ferrugineus TaxID=1413221 RepID=A0A7M2SYY2_9ACTN|nr:hypothetical protein [Streptomyces ferrugineus]QOV41587.1 hypothetical protein IM697_31415 [Streptomyces ferrugineus]